MAILKNYFFPCMALALGSFTLMSKAPGPDEVTVNIIDEMGALESLTFVWPFQGPPPIGAADPIVDSLYIVMQEICPPERKKISENIWKCGNGKKINTDDKRMAGYLSSQWDNER